jgi:hypothetical protein
MPTFGKLSFVDVQIMIMKLLVLALFVIAVSTRAQEAPRPPVIDVHLHLIPEVWLPAPPHSVQSIPGASSQQEIVRETLAQMKEHNVVLGLVSEWPDGLELLQRADPDRIFSYPLPDAKHPLDLEELKLKLASGEWRGIGEIGTQYDGLEPTDATLWPYYELADRLDVPVFWHTGMSFPGITRDQPRFRADLGRPLRWEDVFVEHPDLRAVLMHAGYPFLDEMLAVLGIYPEVYVDTGAIVHLLPAKAFYRYIGALIDAGYGNRVLYGTDQMGWPQAIGYGIEVIENAPWDENVKRAILYDNAARFLQLSDEEIARHHGKSTE